MKYFKNSANAVYAFEADGSQDAFIGPELVSISVAEAEALSQPLTPPLAVPRIVPMLNAQIVLSRAGKLTRVENLIQAMSGQAGIEARITWARAQTVDRDSDLVQTLIAEVPLTEEETDCLFAEAAALP
ncbi:hypothetical protein RD110_08140 [Rhodoferax koreense]|uniref:DUF4376 domain-containing protein n=1 Tax=Rhodoferax koreensis TaxID=1842727 RepID=A0A1P8JTV1_9BURK|nr:hypothetical protein [Rhodoferax koreense]APW37173.1 hypothetical protein RD110_08140 [Rhodoferax koreense]